MTEMSHMQQFPDSTGTGDMPSRRRATFMEFSDSVDIVFEDSASQQQQNNAQLNASITNYGDSSISMSDLLAVRGSPMGTVPSPLMAPKIYLYIQMQLCQSASLRDWLAKNTRERDHEYMFDIFFQIVSAVDYVHKNNLIHRDLKPSNIFFAADGTVCVGDFGLVTTIEHNKEDKQQLRLVASTGTDGQRQHTACVGTELYMSPEQLQGHAYDAKVDMFSLGLILLELFHPFDTQNERARVLTGARNQVLPTRFIDEQETKLIKQLLSANPQQRPTSGSLLEHPQLQEAGQRKLLNNLFNLQRSRSVSSCSNDSGHEPSSTKDQSLFCNPIGGL